MWYVLKKGLRDSRRTVFWLSIGLGLYAIMILSFFPSIVREQDKFDELMDAYPSELMSVFVGDDFREFNIASPASFLQLEYITWVILILGGIVTAQAFNAILNPERNGTMDLALSLPISRRSLLLGRLGSTAIGLLIVLTACLLGLIMSSIFIEEFDVPADKLAVGIYAIFFIVMAQAGIAYFLASLAASHHHWPGPLAYTSFFAAYLLNGFAGMVDILDTLSPLYLFKYYNATNVINDGLDLGNTVVLIGVAVVFSSAAWWLIDEKDLGV
jgi:ABC-2 type transport system permease protein